VLEALHGGLDVGGLRAHLRVEVAAVLEVRDRHAEEMTAAEVIGEPGVRLDLADTRRAAPAAAADLDVVLERADDPGDLEDRERRGEPILQRLEEELLARDTVDVGVRVPEADEVERLLAVEQLVARRC